MESELSVRDILTKEYVGVSESDTVLGAVRLMREERSACVLVVRGTDPVGIMTEWDVLGVVAEGHDPEATTVEDVMSTPVMTIGVDRSLADAADTMARENIRNLVVEDEDRILGVLTQRDVIAAAGSFQGVTSTSPPNSPSMNQPANDDTAPGTGTGTETELIANGGDEYTTQGVCEACGSLSDALYESNGQLVCSDCRSV